MSAQSTFPAFIRAEYDGSSGGFPAFERAAEQSFGRVEGRARQFERSFQEIGKVVSNAISGGINTSGGLDLKVGEFRQAAAQAQFYEKSLRDVQAAANLLAKETGDISAETTKYLQALNANVNEAQRATSAADAQVATYTRLQAALDATAAKNSQLASSYRELFTEQAKQAQQEVVARRAQEGFTAVFAPGATRSATANGAGFTALEDQLKREGALIANLNAGVSELEGRFAREAQQQAQAASQAAAAIARQADEMDRLRGAEAAAANAADMLSAVFRNTPLVNGAATANGAGFEALAADMQRAETAAQQYSASLNALRQQVDPAYFAQQRFGQEMSFAAEAMKRGDITAAQYASRLSFLTAELKQNAASTRQARFASIQLGQQLSDVVIQAQMGTNAFVILAQQGSQAAYALTGLGGTVGKVAGFLSSWQGAVILAAVALAGQFVPALLSSATAANQTADALSKVKFSSSDLTNAQGILGTVMDTATGKMKAQREELVALGIAQAKVAALMAGARAQAARGAVQDLQNPTTEFSAGFGGGIDISRRPAGAVGVISKEVLSGETDARDAVERLSNLQKAGRLTEEQFAAAAAAVTSLGIELQNVKINEAAERLLKGIGTNADKELLLTPHKPKKDHSADAAAVLAERGEDAAKKIANITDRFSDIPPQVRQVNTAMRELDDLADDFARKKPPNYTEIVKALDDARKMIDEVGRNLPFTDLLEQQQQQLELGTLALANRTAEVDATKIILSLEKQMGPLKDEQRAQILGNVIALRQQSRELEKQQKIQQNLLDLVQSERDATKNLINDLLHGQGTKAVGSFFKNIFDSYLNALSEEITQSLAGDFFGKQTDKIKGETTLSDAGDRMAGSIDTVKESLNRLANAVDKTAAHIDGSSVTTPGAAANDNGDIVVTARRTTDQTLRSGLKELGSKIFGEKNAAKFGAIAGQAMQGAAIGTVTSGVLKSVGIKQSKTGAQIGGALGNFIPGLPPGVGSLIGSIAGGLIGGLFKKAKFGSVTIGATNSGSLGITGSAGNSGAAIKASTKSGGAVIDSIEQIAQQLGGTIDASKGSVSIGTYKGKYRVDTSGQGRTKGMTSSESTNESLGLFNFGDDADAAVKFAMLNLVQDGVIVGIRAGSAKLLKNAKDIETGLSKALKFENVFRDLRKFKDPVGAAIDDLNLEFKGLIDVFKEAGATAEETAQLEELYGIKRKAATEDAIKSLTGSLKDLIDNLTIGDSGYSLRTRLSNAKTAYDPLAARVQAGDTTAYDEYAKAAQTLVDLQREYSGSQQDYFTLLDSVTQLTKGELNRQQAQISSSTGIGSPFDTTPIVTATQQQQAAIVDAINAQGAAANDNQGRMIVLMQQYLAAAAGTGNARLAIAGRFGF